MPTIQDRFRIRRGTAADLATVNEIPLADEIVYESDQGLLDGKYKLKIGDGVTHYNDLPYFATGGGIESIFPGNGIDVDATDPKNPVVSATYYGILSGRKDIYANLPSGLGAEDSGKAYLVESDNLVYVWDGAAWPADGSGAPLATSGLLQCVTISSASTQSTTSTGIPLDNTIPQATEGDALTDYDITITPVSASSRLEVSITMPWVSGNPSTIGMRLSAFRDSGSNAVFAVSFEPGTNRPTAFVFEAPSNSTSATTFRFRWGVSSGTGYINRTNATPAAFGGVMKVLVSVREIAA